MTDESESVTVNGTEYSDDACQQVVSVLSNIEDTRSTSPTSRGTGSSFTTSGDLRARYGNQFGDDREVWDVLGYDKDPDFEDLLKKWKRGDIAPRIVNIPAQDTWKNPPEVVDPGTDGETEFERVTNQWLEEEFTGVARRIDIAAGIGEYGLLVLGLADDPDTFLDDVDESAFSGDDPLTDIAYYEAINQGEVADWQLGKEVGRGLSDPRYNKPVEYEVGLGDTAGDPSDDEDAQGLSWQRAIHVPAQEPVFSQLKAQPRLLSTLNRLEDREKIVGSAAEAFWHSADRRFHFDVRDAFNDDIDLSALDDEAQKLIHDLQPYFKSSGVDLNVIGGEDVNPEPAFDPVLKLISGATGIPQRKLVGSERGEQASMQDRINWFDKISSRQSNYAEDFILRPTLDRLIGFGILPEPEAGDYEVEWPNLFELSEIEKAEVELNRSKALKNAMPQGNTDLMPGGLEAVIEYLETGDLPDMDDQDQISDPMDLPEDDPQVQAFWSGHE